MKSISVLSAQAGMITVISIAVTLHHFGKINFGGVGLVVVITTKSI
jgi:hypothetical protein